MFANLCSVINTREINKIFSRDGITCKICLFFGVGANKRCSYANFRSLTLISGEFRLRWGIFALFCVLILGKKWLMLIARNPQSSHQVYVLNVKNIRLKVFVLLVLNYWMFGWLLGVTNFFLNRCFFLKILSNIWH